MYCGNGKPSTTILLLLLETLIAIAWLMYLELGK